MPNYKEFEVPSEYEILTAMQFHNFGPKVQTEKEKITFFYDSILRLGCRQQNSYGMNGILIAQGLAELVLIKGGKEHYKLTPKGVWLAYEWFK